MRRVLLADAGWVVVLGVGLCAAPWTVHSWFGLAPGELWPLFVALGVASLGYSGVLLYAARSDSMRAFCRFGAIANAVSVPVVLAVNVVPGLEPPARIALAVVAILCAIFAVAEWRLSAAATQDVSSSTSSSAAA